ncbi:unnamed protein product, partial [Protopolystoma xenopodis]
MSCVSTRCQAKGRAEACREVESTRVEDEADLGEGRDQTAASALLKQVCVVCDCGVYVRRAESGRSPLLPFRLRVQQPRRPETEGGRTRRHTRRVIGAKRCLVEPITRQRLLTHCLAVWLPRSVGSTVLCVVAFYAACANCRDRLSDRPSGPASTTSDPTIVWMDTLTREHTGRLAGLRDSEERIFTNSTVSTVSAVSAVSAVSPPTPRAPAPSKRRHSGGVGRSLHRPTKRAGLVPAGHEASTLSLSSPVSVFAETPTPAGYYDVKSDYVSTDLMGLGPGVYMTCGLANGGEKQPNLNLNPNLNNLNNNNNNN